MSALPFVFTSPYILFGLLALPAIWWLLRLTPPRPKAEVFPPLKILATVLKREETPSKSPWWLTLLRMALAAAVIFALADPVVNPRNNSIAGSGPLVLVVDNSWASAPDWERRVATAQALIGDAERADRPVSISFTADAEHDAVPGTTAVALEKLAAAKPKPLVPDRVRTTEAITEALNGTAPGTIAYIADGVQTAQDESAMRTLASLSPAEFRIVKGDGKAITAITGATNNADAMSVTLSRLDTAEAARLTVNAQDSQGRILANGVANFAPGAAETTATVEAPFELRNDFARLSLEGVSTAGAVHLLDDGFRRRRVALLAGETGNDFQPLLQPLYYISRALQPFADLIPQRQADLAQAIPEILQSNPSVIVMADIGRLPQETYEPMQRWLAGGGTLIRFAGPRLAAAPADDPLVPVTLRQGERALGGALSWAEPQPLADFPNFGAFAGMPKADGVLVKRQVLAEPTPDLAERTWASLADGTPLVTTRNVEAGRIVLFHVSAEASWSDLPISGHFVDMLRRIVQLSKAGGASANANAPAAALPPFRLLTAEGALSAEIGTARPLEMRAGQPPRTGFDNPPGLYGTEDGFVALNLLPAGATLRPLDTSAAGVSTTSEALIGETAKSLRPALFIAAFLMLIADSLIVLFMNGAFARLPKARSATAAAVLLAFGAFAAMSPTDARADDPKPGDEQIFERLDTTHLAYVRTGEDDVDRISEQGLQGLSEFLTWRTTLEPGQPVGLDISKDELSFYPIIYWPVSATAPMPSSAAISRIDAYMRAGGTVLFDTRDQFSSLDTGATSPNGERLQAILANIDIPPLEPVPEDHVLTRSFYLLTNFPGRYNGSPLWVESRQGAAKTTSGLSSSGDGVTPIMITGNDFAGAWAVDPQGAPVLPTVPPDEMQREHAFRSGVNIMMYMLTGNYKADQVHVPALLERLGQ
ncbi:transmembrane protein [Agrobacterium tumefaciens str. Cherry 2E-2-2]|nr:transmembrane protein [Agrobacterium tumefaciens str. Cherry 2E-2-2]